MFVLVNGLEKLYQVKLNKQLMADDEDEFKDHWFEIVVKSDLKWIYRLAEAVMVGIYIAEGTNEGGSMLDTPRRKTSRLVDRASIVRERLASLPDTFRSSATNDFFPYKRGEIRLQYLPLKPQSITSRLDKNCMHPIDEREVDRDKIISFYKLPEEQVQLVDHTADVPGLAFSLGYSKKRVEIRQKARDQLETSYVQFAQGKSFWTIVKTIPKDKTKVVFLDSDGEKIPFYSNEFDDNADRSFNGTLNNSHHKAFDIHRVRDNLVVIDIDELQWDASVVPELRVPPGHDLIINPAFFAGSNFLNVAQDDLQFIGKESNRNGNMVFESYVSTLSEGIARGFLFIFGWEWGKLVDKVERDCKAGNDANDVPWPIFLQEGMATPAPAYFDIPKGYWTYASGLLLGMYQTRQRFAAVGVREVWAAGGALCFLVVYQSMR